MGDYSPLCDFLTQPTTMKKLLPSNHNLGKSLQLFLFAFLGLLLLTGCSKSDDNSSEGAEGDWAGWGTGVETPTLKQDFNKSDMDNFFELNLKMENMRLQFVKFMSNGWEGELLDGPGVKSDPMEMFELLEEILDKKDDYTQAINNLTYMGILDNVTTRGLETSAWDMIVNGWGSTAKNRRIKILDMLEANKVMGDADAQQELFNALPTKLKKGETNAKQWFINLNQGKYDNACPQIHTYWVNTGAGKSGDAGSALGKYYEATEKAADGKDPIHTDTYKVGIEQAQKAANFNAALWDEVTGGYAGKWADADVIVSETSKLRQKIKDGSATMDDFNKWVVGVGSIYAKEKIGEILDGKVDKKDPDWVRIIKEHTPEGSDDVAGDIVDWLTERATAEADERAANSNGVTLGEIRNSIHESGHSPTCFILINEDGKTTVTGADKDGNGRFVSKAGNKTITTVTSDGKRATQKINTKAGKQTIEAIPSMESEYEWKVEIDPEELDFDYQPDTKVAVVTTYAKYFSAKSNNKDWLHVSVNGPNIIVEVEQNDTGEPRYGTVTIGLSQDKKTYPRSATLEVFQRAEPEAADLASIIDFENLSIEGLEYSVDTSEGTGDNMRYARIVPSDFLGNTSFSREELASFAATELTTRRISNNVYEVTGRKIEPYEFDGWTAEEALLARDDPYGAFYEISFNIEAHEPTTPYLIKEYNFIITNFKAQGYYKWRHHHYDNLYKFSFEAAVAVIDKGGYSNGSCKLTALYAGIVDEKPSFRWEVSQKGFDETPYEDANQTIHYELTPINLSNKGSSTSVLHNDFGMTLHW